VENFTDPMVDCRQCKARYRLDILLEDLSVKKKKEVLRELEPATFQGQLKDEVVTAEFEKRAEAQSAVVLPLLACPSCGTKGSFTDARKFNLMFKTFIGPVEDSSAAVFLRPETAQGIFVNFLNVQQSMRKKVPFGIAQIGKAFRNEINTKNFLFRTREFEQMEMQFFVRPGSDDAWFEEWRRTRMQWFLDLGMTSDKLQWHQHPADKLAHYAKDAYDIEYRFPFGRGEIEGVHNRTSFDLSRHQEYSGKGLEYFDDETKEKYIPFVIETSAGASRSCMAFLVDAWREEEAPTAEGKAEIRTVMKFHPKLAPMKAAILPLVNREGMDEIAHSLYKDLQKNHRVFYDDGGSIGRRYRRQDEIGTPYSFTVDSDTLKDQTVTVRDRDTMNQERIPIARVKEYLSERLGQS
jgi:glycyl-tRNA synthetase